MITWLFLLSDFKEHTCIQFRSLQTSLLTFLLIVPQKKFLLKYSFIKSIHKNFSSINFKLSAHTLWNKQILVFYLKWNISSKFGQATHSLCVKLPVINHNIHSRLPSPKTEVLNFHLGSPKQVANVLFSQVLRFY